MAGGPSFQSLAVLQAHQGAGPNSSMSSDTAPGPNPQGHAAQSGPIKKRRKRGEADGKRYPCDQCEKSFSRPDHLSRHKLNHNPSQIYECTRCPKTFVRLDLLVRHTDRHERKERGEEPADAARKAERRRQNSIAGTASGSTTGGANTTPQSYDLPGNGQQPPPPGMNGYGYDHSQALQQHLYHAISGAGGMQAPSMPAFSMIQNAEINAHTPSSGTYSTLSPHNMSQASGSPADNAFSAPPTGTSSMSGPSPPSAFPNSLVIQNDFANRPPDSMHMPHPALPQMQMHHPGIGQPPPQQQQPPPQQQQQQQQQQPMPPNGLSLVDQALVASQALASAAHQQPVPPMHHPVPHPQPHPHQMPASHPHQSPFAFNVNAPLAPPASHHDFEEPFNFLSANYGAPFASASDYSWLFAPDQSFDVHFTASRPASPGAGAHSDFFAGLAGGPGIGGTQTPARLAAVAHALNGHAGLTSQLDKVSQQLEATAAKQQQQQNHHASTPSHDLLGGYHGPLSPAKLETVAEVEELSPSIHGSVEAIPNGYANAEEIVPDPNDPTTFVDEITRQRVIEYLGTEWSHLRDDPRLGVSQMAHYLTLFWVKVHETQAPAVHRASFRPGSTQTPLLLAMMLLGSYFAPPESYQLAVQLHPWFRGKVLCSPDFRPRSEIWLMQTLLLITVFGKLCSTRMDHEMSHIFQSSFVQLGRRSGLFSQRAYEIPEDKHDDIEFQWRAWIEEEVSKRLAQIVFAMDVEHAAFFRHAHTLSAFQIQLPMPCDEDLWEATSADEWKRLHDRARQPIQFISALKASLTAVNETTSLNPFSRISVLHGLLSVAQDLQWRDHVLGFSSPERRSQNWRDMISSAYNLWKQRLDEALVNASPATTQLLRASISLYATAQITFSIDIHELQIYAGAETAAGLIVSPAVFHATETRIRMWSGSREGRASTWHAVHFLRSCLQHWRQSTADLAGCLHHRWTVYIAFLAVYAFGRSTSGHPAPPQHNDPDASVRYLDAMCTGTPDGLLAVSGKQNCLDLCVTVQEYIRDTRWELVQDAARILSKLIRQDPITPPV
ncbi:hypothetical protein BMF94_1783 [Rhodotorula taiwanensis]|uniref:C2H2-type domain-containing protein n=1 Tax=Rhodotorula taiwanensis TaxID=741276 RepID=A0A2S5BEH1_9BASI|nr:hypothetical protein BMF94_1783 [Rhodotorula taiwanensis]